MLVKNTLKVINKHEYDINDKKISVAAVKPSVNLWVSLCRKRVHQQELRSR